MRQIVNGSGISKFRVMKKAPKLTPGTINRSFSRLHVAGMFETGTISFSVIKADSLSMCPMVLALIGVN